MATEARAYLHQPRAAELRWMGETSTYFLADGDQTGEQFALVEERAVHGESVPLHLHREDAESFYVLEGEIMLFVGEQPGARAGAGAFAHIPGGTVHGFRIVSETARYLIMTTPRHARFYREITLPSRPDGLPALDSVDGSQIRQACEKFGVEFVAPLPADA